jgi:hypothetical protein
MGEGRGRPPVRRGAGLASGRVPPVRGRAQQPDAQARRRRQGLGLPDGHRRRQRARLRPRPPAHRLRRATAARAAGASRASRQTDGGPSSPTATRASASTAPTTLAIDGKGRIYFTDPRYSKRENLELDKEGVYRIDPDGTLTRVADSLTRPNGIVVTADGATLYVADNASPGGVVTLVAFDLDAAGRRAAGASSTTSVEAAASTAWPSTRAAASGRRRARRRRPGSTSSRPTARA